MNLPAANCVRRALRDAEERRTSIEVHMPGGLDPSMREIIQDILSSPVPLAVALEGSSFFSLPPRITSLLDLRISCWQIRGALASMGAFMLSVMAQLLPLHKAPLRNGPAPFVACMSRVGRSVHT